MPRIVEETLREHGVLDPWGANASLLAATTLDIYRTYMEEVRPLRRFARPGGIVAIEVRGARMNDSYIAPRDRAYLYAQSGSLRNPSQRLAALRAGAVDGLTRFLLGRLAIVKARERIRNLVRRTAPSSGRGGEDFADAGLWEKMTWPSWARGDKGWYAHRGPRSPDLKERRTRKVYQNRILRGYRLGGIRSEYLVRLIRQVHADGLLPVAYAMPLTQLHRSFYPPEKYAAFLRHMRELAEREGFPFVDLDSDHGLPLSDFHDTHHLSSHVVPEFSRRFAERVLLPYASSRD